MTPNGSHKIRPSEKTWDRGAALTSRLQTFETELLAAEGFTGLTRINRELIGKAETIDSPQRVVLDMDSTEIPMHGQQENSAYNGHFESTCYDPLVLFNRPRVGFIVTNLETDSRAVVRFYNKRGTAEQWIKEGKLAVKMTRVSCHRFRPNEVRLMLSLIAHNLGNLWRRLVLPKKIDHWSLTSLPQRLVKHARYYWLMLAESHLTRRLFGSVGRRMEALPVPSG